MIPQRRLCVVTIQSERVRTYLSSVARTLIVKLFNGRRTHRGADRSAWVTSGCLPSLERPADLSFLPERPADPPPLFERPLDLCLRSKITDLILSFLVPCISMNNLFSSRMFLFMAGYRNLHTFVFFPVICRSYMSTGISVTLSIGSKLYSLFFPLCCCYLATALNLLSSSSPAKLLYYTPTHEID